MKIYVASSWRNDLQPVIVALLKQLRRVTTGSTGKRLIPNGKTGHHGNTETP